MKATKKQHLAWYYNFDGEVAYVGSRKVAQATRTLDGLIFVATKKAHKVVGTMTAAKVWAQRQCEKGKR